MPAPWGRGGRILGIDPSAEMLAAGRSRCAEFDWVEMLDGSVADIPLGDGRADGAVSLQVFEYLDDLSATLREIGWVLRSGRVW